jgi:hypothetical protein
LLRSACIFFILRQPGGGGRCGAAGRAPDGGGGGGGGNAGGGGPAAVCSHGRSDQTPGRNVGRKNIGPVFPQKKKPKKPGVPFVLPCLTDYPR